MIEPPVLALNAIVKSFGVVKALRGVSVAFRSGEICALIGENGAGKSTLMRVMEGEHHLDSGTIAVNGEQVVLNSAREAHAYGIRVIHQEPEIIPQMTVAENIFIGDYRAKGGVFLDTDDLMQRANDLIDVFGVGDALQPDRLCHGLGPAQRQLIEIMRALRPGAKLLAFDEPTSSLTEDEAGRLFQMIRRLKSEQVAIVYVSHRLREIVDLADRCVVLRDGEKVADTIVADIDEAQMVRLMVGRPISDLFHRRKRDLGSVRLALSGVTTSHVHDVNFGIRAGEIVGLAGLIGAGRTEIARAIVGVDQLISGQMEVSGVRFRPRQPIDGIKVGIGYVPEDRKQEALLLMQSVRDNASLVIPDLISRFGFFNRRREEGIVSEHVKRLRIKTPSISQLVGKLSGGNQQKVVFARWLARQPKILILDEPTRGIDVGAKAEIYQLIEMLADQGLAILLISSEMPELLGLADRILTMRAGHMTGELDGATASEEAVLDLAMRHPIRKAS